MHDISFRHAQGGFSLQAEFSLVSQRTVLFGASGAGKSTLLRILAGLIRPQAGRFELDGTLFLDTAKGVFLPAGSRSIGFVSQQPALFPHLNVSDNVGFGIRHLDRPARSRRVLEMLELFGAEALADRRTPQLSGGERQRVALARALAPAPRLLLLDEPLAALDSASVEDILTRLLALDVRLVYVSHDVTEIWRMPANAVLLEDGRVLATGPLQQVVRPWRDRLLQQLNA